MRITGITAAMLITGAMTRAEPNTGQQPRVTVCLQETDPRAGPAVSMAEALASRMFAGIGIALEWHIGIRACPQAAIFIGLSYNTPAGLKPEALAISLPYQGTRITVFYDRIIRNRCEGRAALVLAHVFVHEITHMLQGIDRHSDSGIMKATWDEGDYQRMTRKPLPFSDLDVDLIYAGLTSSGRRPPSVATAKMADTQASASHR